MIRGVQPNGLSSAVLRNARVCRGVLGLIAALGLFAALIPAAAAQEADPSTTTSTPASTTTSTPAPTPTTTPITLGTAPPDVSAQINAGTDAPEADVPWIAALVDPTVANARDGVFCGGALVDPSWVVTTAECVSKPAHTTFQVVIGETDLSSVLPAQRRAVTSVVVHPAFTHQGYFSVPANDIALVHLTAPVLGTPTLTYDSGSIAVGSKLTTIFGWGVAGAVPYHQPVLLQETRIGVLNDVNGKCYAPSLGPAGAWPTTDFTESNMICPRPDPANPTADTCVGDQGTPMAVGSPGGFRLLALASFGYASCADGPAIYTRLSTFAGWIDTVVGDPGYVGTLNPIPPVRVLDTRPGSLNVGGLKKTPLAPGQTIFPQITGMGGVPTTGVSSVVLNVTATGPTSGGWLSLFPAGSRVPDASSLNFTAGQTVPNLVTVKLGEGGKVGVSNTGVEAGGAFDTPGGGAGTVNVIVDVVGWYANNTSGAYFHPIAPNRLVDTRGGAAPNSNIVGPVAGQGTITPIVRGAGVGGDTLVDPSATAVVLNVTATGPTTAGWLTVYPEGSTPTASNLNFVPGQTVPNLVTVKVGADNRVRIRNSFGNVAAGTVHVVVDVVGWYGPPGTVGSDGTQYHAMVPVRLMDDRGALAAATPNPTMTAAIPPQVIEIPQVRNVGRIPVEAAAVALNATVTAPTAAGWLTLYPDIPSQPPTASNLNFVAGQTVANAAIVKVTTLIHKIGVANTVGSSAAGSTYVILDAVGWFQ